MFQVAGQNDAYDMGIMLLDFCQQLSSIHFRHFLIGNNDIDGRFSEDIQSLHGAGRERHFPFIAHFPQCPLQAFEYQRLIIYK